MRKADERLVARPGFLLSRAFGEFARVRTLADDLWLGYLETWRSLSARPGFPDYWEGHRARYSREFQAYVDSALLRRQVEQP